ncbi:MAG TPA: hypothetical protein VF765_11810 [Polyangiaceae bacterium]
MPLARSRCPACSLPLGDPPPTAVPVRCSRCGREKAVQIAADGQPAGFDPMFNAARLLEWLAYARGAMGAGTPGVAVGACDGCGSPLLVSSRQEMALPCPHCAEPVKGPAGRVLVDQWTEPWTRIDGDVVDLEYRLVVLEGARGTSAGCAACGAPTPAGDPAMKCASCGAVTWVEREGGRVQLGVRVDGTRDGKPYKAVVPIVQGESMLSADARRGAGARSSSSLLGITGVGCASLVAAFVLLIVAIAMAAHFVHC